jgi:hypothetical protein
MLQLRQRAIRGQGRVRGACRRSNERVCGSELPSRFVQFALLSERGSETEAYVGEQPIPCPCPEQPGERFVEIPEM